MNGARPRVLFVTAECQPIAKVGGLGEAVAGLTRALRHSGYDIEIVMPDYGHVPLDDETAETLHVPTWAGRLWMRRGSVDGLGKVTLIGSRTIRRPHPYCDPSTGESWPDNDERFFAFSAGVAAFASQTKPALVHFHDWHGAAAACLLDRAIPTAVSIHNLAHQGIAESSWIDRIGAAAEPMRLPGVCDPLVGAIRRADSIFTVSPTYAHEMCGPQSEGISEILLARSSVLHGVLNGIDTDIWDPGSDPRIPYSFDRLELRGKAACRAHLIARIGAQERTGPVVAVVSRMAQQKGIDMAIRAARVVADADGVVIFHGAGQNDVCSLVSEATQIDAAHVHSIDGYDETVAHRLIAGADMLLMPSRFEPCGLTQLQAMRYATVPVVTNVGGLHDTVRDDDVHPDQGTGFVSDSLSSHGVSDALGRAIMAMRDQPRWIALQRRVMAVDSSWASPARAIAQIYSNVLGDRCSIATARS